MFRKDFGTNTITALGIINLLVIKQVDCFYCAVRTESLNLSLKGRM